MRLSEMRVGENAVLLGAPPRCLPQVLLPGRKISLVLKRHGLAVIEVEGIGIALSGDLAERIVVVRAPT